ncbi:MAG TPA: isochorismatase family cysteine hydrolase [Ilumatobacteraceae bacterium]
MDVPSTSIEVTARPEPFRLAAATTAVIVVDMQNDFASPGGMFDRAGIDIAGIQAIVPNVQAVVAAARNAGALIVYLKMAFSADLIDAGYPTSPTWLKHIRMRVGDAVTSPQGEPSRILVRDCWNTDIVPELDPVDGDVVLYKTRYSGFYNTELDAILRGRGVEQLVVVGATTSVCVESTVRDAMFRDYHCLVISDATAEPIAAGAPRSNHEASLLTLELLFASVAQAEDLVASLRLVAPVSR